MQQVLYSLNGIPTIITAYNRSVILNIQCGTSSTPALISPAITLLTTAVCKWIDATHSYVILPSSVEGPGTVIEIVPESGAVTVLPPSPTTFFDGSTSFTASVGVIFKYVPNSLGVSSWARFD